MNAPHLDEDADDIPYRAEVARKLLHLLALVIPFVMWRVGREASIAILVPLALLTTLADVLRVRARWFHELIERFFGFMMRGRERPPFDGPIVLNGATCVIISAAMLAVVFPIGIAVPSLAVFMVADAAAALAGRRFGRHEWPRSTRTVEGSVAFAATSALIFLLLGTFHPAVVAIAVLVGTITEIFPGPFNDNIQVPFLMALAITISHTLIVAA